jgi:hypothetical protein
MTTAPDSYRALAVAPVSFEGVASAAGALLRAPASGQPCVYWRVRIAQRLTDRSQLVHEIASEEAFELLWGREDRCEDGREDGRGAVRVRLEPDQARIEAPPVLYREGTPGAAAAAQLFGLAGPVSVEETIIRPGEALTAEGLIHDLDAAVGAGPLRGTSRGPELVDALVTLESKSLAPVLLPWALGTAAALMSGMGLATYAAWRAHVFHLPPVAAVRLPRMNAQLLAPEIPHPLLP